MTLQSTPEDNLQLVAGFLIDAGSKGFLFESNVAHATTGAGHEGASTRDAFQGRQGFEWPEQGDAAGLSGHALDGKGESPLAASVTAAAVDFVNWRRVIN